MLFITLLFTLSGALALRAPITAAAPRAAAAAPRFARATTTAAPRTPGTAMAEFDNTVPTVISEDYKLALALIATGGVVLVAPWLPGGFFLLLGLFLVVQTLRIRFVFDDDAFEVKTKPFDQLFSSSPLAATGENFAVGGENRWRYDSFVNWQFFPSEDIPILVYFKETQTPEDKWAVGPGEMANSAEALAKGAVKGQVHFFPCIASKDDLKEQFIAKGCAKL